MCMQEGVVCVDARCCVCGCNLQGFGKGGLFSLIFKGKDV